MGYTYSEALDAVKEGLTIYRSGWNGSGLRVELQTPDEKSKMSMPYLFIRYPSHGRGAGQCGPWVPSNSDQFADDWCIEGRTSYQEADFFDAKRIRAALSFCHLGHSQGAVCTEVLRLLGGSVNPALLEKIANEERRAFANRSFPDYPWIDNRVVLSVHGLDLILRRELLSFGAYADRIGDDTVITDADIATAEGIPEMSELLAARAKLVTLLKSTPASELSAFVNSFDSSEEK